MQLPDGPPPRFLQRVPATLREARTILVGTTAALGVTMLVGYLSSDLFREWVQSFRASMANEPVSGYWTDVRRTLLHNLILDYLALRLGYATFGLVPAGYLVVNGVFVGAFVGNIVPADRLPTLALLLPHGVFELSALVLAVGLGIWMGTRGRRSPGLPHALRGAHAVFLALILPLAIMAALIESWDYTDWRPRFLPALAPSAVVVRRRSVHDGRFNRRKGSLCQVGD